jgi:hypothetical protein
VLTQTIFCPGCQRRIGASLEECPFCETKVKTQGAAIERISAGAIPATKLPSPLPPKPPSVPPAKVPSNPPPAKVPSNPPSSRRERPAFKIVEEEKPEEKPGGWAKHVVVAILVVGLLAGIYVAWDRLRDHAVVYVVNVTGKDGVSIVVDDDTAVPEVPFAASEAADKLRQVRLKTGTHKIEARDVSGALLDSATFEVSSAAQRFLFAPKADPSVCFVISSPTGYERLERGKSLMNVTGRAEVVLQPSTDKYALRQLRCDDPALAGKTP